MTSYRVNLIIAVILWALLMYWWFPFQLVNTSDWKGASILFCAVVGAFLILNFLVGFVRGFIEQRMNKA
jgi:hypothetical protein